MIQQGSDNGEEDQVSLYLGCCDRGEFALPTGDGVHSLRSRSSMGGVPWEQKCPSIPGWREGSFPIEISPSGRIGSAPHLSGPDSSSLGMGSE